jgi:hypothetical protein
MRWSWPGSGTPGTLATPGDPGRPTLRSVQEAGLGEVDSGPVDAVVEGSLASAREHLLKILLGELEVFCKRSPDRRALMLQPIGM